MFNEARTEALNRQVLERAATLSSTNPPHSTEAITSALFIEERNLDD